MKYIILYLLILVSFSSAASIYPCKNEKKILKKYTTFKVVEFEEGEIVYSSEMINHPLSNKKNFFNFTHTNSEGYDVHLVSGAWANRKYSDDEDFQKYPIFSCVAVIHDEGHDGDDYEETHYIKATSKKSFITYYDKEDIKNKSYTLYEVK